MESYCVIQFNDKQEKGKILTFLAVETEAEYKVTADLKGFVAKQFNVTILENVVVSPNDIDSVTINRIIAENTVNIAPTTVDTLQNGQQPTQSSSFPDPIVANQPIPVIDNTQNLINMDDVVNIDVIGNDSVENTSDDDVMIINHVETPSSPTTRRSSRSTKRPNYLMTDETDEESDEEDTPVINNSKKNKASVKVARRKTKKSICNKCGVEVTSSYTHKMRHVVVHTDIIKFECMVNGCGLKYKTRRNVKEHMKKYHKRQLNSFAEVQTAEQKSNIDSMMKECFNDSEDDNGDRCQICNQTIRFNVVNLFNTKKEHALHHVDFMLYTCAVDRCPFESKSSSSMKKHSSQAHSKVTNLKLIKIKLTAEQELEIQNMYAKCFPSLENDGDES